MRTIHNTINELQELWEIMFENLTPAPSERQLAIWLTRYGNETVREGLAQTAIKFRKLNGQMNEEHILKFTSAVMSRLQGTKCGFACAPSLPANQSYMTGH